MMSVKMVRKCIFCFSVQPKKPILTANVGHSVLKGSTVNLTCTTQSKVLQNLTYIFLRNKSVVLKTGSDSSYIFNTSTVSGSASYSCIAQYTWISSHISTAKEIIVVGK